MARLLFFMFCLMVAKVAAAAGIVACGGDNGWPPSSYFGPPQHNNARPVLGYSPDVLHAVLSASAFRPEFVLLPFRRCLSLAEQGRQVQVVMGATFSTERARQFLFSRHYLHLRPALFLWPGAAPGLPLCGLVGFNYAPFGVKPDEVDEGSSSYLLVMKKMQAGRCRGFAEYVEVGRSLQLLGWARMAGVCKPGCCLAWCRCRCTSWCRGPTRTPACCCARSTGSWIKWIVMGSWMPCWHGIRR